MIQKIGHMVFKGDNWVHNDKIRSNGLERSQLGVHNAKSGHMVLKGINWVHNAKIRSYGLGKSQLGTQQKLGKMVLKESVGYTMKK